MIRVALIALILNMGFSHICHAGNCYAPVSYAPTYYAPAYKYVVLYQIGVEQRVDAIAKKAANDALDRYRDELEKGNNNSLSGRVTTTVELSSESSSASGSSNTPTTFSKVRSGYTVGTEPTGSLAASETRCKDCHGGDAKKADGKKFAGLATLSSGGAKAALRYITRLDEKNCAKKAALEADAHWELQEALREIIAADRP